MLTTFDHIAYLVFNLTYPLQISLSISLALYNQSRDMQESCGKRVQLASKCAKIQHVKNNLCHLSITFYETHSGNTKSSPNSQLITFPKLVS